MMGHELMEKASPVRVRAAKGFETCRPLYASTILGVHEKKDLHAFPSLASSGLGGPPARLSKLSMQCENVEDVQAFPSRLLHH